MRANARRAREAHVEERRNVAARETAAGAARYHDKEDEEAYRASRSRFRGGEGEDDRDDRDYCRSSSSVASPSYSDASGADPLLGTWGGNLQSFSPAAADGGDGGPGRATRRPGGVPALDFSSLPEPDFSDDEDDRGGGGNRKYGIRRIGERSCVFYMCARGFSRRVVCASSCLGGCTSGTRWVCRSS